MEKAPHKIAMHGIRELLSLANRLGEKIKDKYIWTHTEMEEAIGYLIYFRDHLKNDPKKQHVYKQIFGESGEFFQIKHFKKGFNMKSITFKTIVGHEVRRWVLKIGYRISIVVDFGDPSTESYYKLHKKHLEILRKKTRQNKLLQNLLPEPLEDMYAVLKEDGKQIATTLIVEPFMHIMKLKKVRKKLTEEQRRKLLKELTAFKKLCKELIEQYHIEPDLLGDGNLEIVAHQNEYKLMLLDTGCINLEAPLPITQTVMRLASMQTLANVENLIKKIL